MQWVLSLIPWWLYAAFGVAIFAAIWFRFGSRPALVYGGLALAWVAYDKGGDDRDVYRNAKVRQEIEHAVDRAKDARERSDAAPVGPDGLPDDGFRRD